MARNQRKYNTEYKVQAVKLSNEIGSSLFRSSIKCTSTTTIHGRELRTQKFIRCSFLCIR